ncbi:enoyl-CoA-hydratase DpgB [Actinocorallia populi]|uniref:enoyl-CoA-hydratase DpgB n=1 Tax=Actinocorallia populi TaxID=2079200 RepID=UPI000D092992|nr:enoyl-CoA-hydratase DpgB [Actinocorallia populi]
MSSADLSFGAALAVDGGRPLSPALVEEIQAFCDLVEDAPGGTAAVIRLHGAQTPLDWPGAVGVDLVGRWEKALRRLERAPGVKIAVVDGPCHGPALELLLTCDYRIGAPDAMFGFPVRDGGVWAGMAVHRLVSQLGGTAARRMVLFGTSLSAQRALDAGLLDELAPDLDGAAARMAAAAAELEPDELAIRRRLVQDAAVTGFEEALGMHLAACERTLARLRDGAKGQVL